MQSIVDHVSDGREYSHSSVTEKKESNVLDRIDGLLNALNEPNYSIEIQSKPSDALTALIAAADSCLNDEKSSLDPR